MKKILISFYVLVFLLGCQGPAVSKEEAKEIAAYNLIGEKKFESDPETEVKLKDGVYDVKFFFPKPGGNPGDTYFSYVKVDAESGEVLELGVDEGLGSGLSPAGTGPSAPQSHRPSPLNEEVDAVAELQNKMKN